MNQSIGKNKTLNETKCCKKYDSFLPYVNEWDGVGKLIDCFVPYQLKEQKSFSILRQLW